MGGWFNLNIRKKKLFEVKFLIVGVDLFFRYLLIIEILGIFVVKEFGFIVSWW